MILYQDTLYPMGLPEELIQINWNDDLFRVKLKQRNVPAQESLANNPPPLEACA
jgi:hypothetical protein